MKKIELGLYEDALHLARKYNLDTDLVYQMQWINSDVDQIHVHASRWECDFIHCLISS